MAEYIKRYLDEKLEQWYKNPNKSSILVNGARRIGKTFAIKHFIKVKFHMIDDKDLPMIDFSKITNAELLYDNYIKSNNTTISFIEYLIADQNIQLNNGCNIIFLDEIQMLFKNKNPVGDEFVSSELNDLTSDKKYKYILSGSLLGTKLSGLDGICNLIETIDYFKMFPIDFTEFVSYFSERTFIENVTDHLKNNTIVPLNEHIKMLKLFALYIHLGGLPETVANYANSKNIIKANSEINSIRENYYNDANQYYKNDFGVDSPDIMQLIVEGLKITNKQSYLKRNFSSDSNRIFLNYLIDTDVALLVSHQSEKGIANEKQEKLKTYLNDIGFLRNIYDPDNEKFITQDNQDSDLMKKILEERYEKFILYIDGNKSKKPNNDGIFFEQFFAQELKSKQYSLTYLYNKTDDSEIEFIINDKYGVDVKSGGFGSMKSCKKQVDKVDKMFICSLFPSIGSYENLIFVPIYFFSFLDIDEIATRLYEKLDEDSANAIVSGRLPDQKGFWPYKID